MDKDLADIEIINFPKTCTILKLVDNNKKNELKNAKHIAYDLYIKFIKVGGKLEINISGEQRERLITIFDNKKVFMNNITIKIKDILLLFEEIKNEMFNLLNITFTLFKYDDKYASLLAPYLK